MPTPRPSTASSSWWPPLAVLGAACIFCWPVFLGRIMLPADMCLLMLPWSALRDQFPAFHRAYNPMLDPIQQYLPWRIYAVESLRAGLLPLWNPYSFCGAPFLANLQSTVLYPLNLLFLITGARHGFGVSAILHLTLGGLFTYAFLTTLGLRRAAALFGALVVMFNGYVVTWLEYPTLSLWVFMWLPAILLCYERSLRRPRSCWLLLAALAVGLQFLGGHLQVSAYVLIAFSLYALTRFLAPQPALPRSRSALLLLLPAALGLALAAAQVLPTLELAAHSGRVSQGAGAAVRTALPATHLILYLVPNFFGNPVAYNYWGSFRDPSAFNFLETACYVGILPLLLSIFAFRRRGPAFWFFAALTVFAVLAALGTPVYLLLYYLAPGFRELAGLARILSLAAFGLAGLSALGLDDLLARGEPSRLGRAPFIFSAAAAAFVLSCLYIFQPVIAALGSTFQAYLLRQIAAFAVLGIISLLLLQARSRLRLSPTAFAAASVVLLVADLFGFGIRFNPFVDSRMAYPETESTRWLREHAGNSRVTSLASAGLDWMPHNAPMIFGLRDLHGSDSLRPRLSFDLVSGPNRDQASYPDPDSPLLDTLGVRYLITRRQLSSKWKLVHSTEAPIYENTAARPRAYLKAVGQERVSCPDPVFLLDDPHAVALTTDSPVPAYLVLTDSLYPGWHAAVDTRPAPIRLTDQAFRGVPLRAGRHLVQFRYDPAAFRVGLFISLLSVSALAGALLALSLITPATASRS